MIISSLQNPRVKAVVSLRNRHARDRRQKMLIEGFRELSRALYNDYPVDDLFFCREMFQGENEDQLIDSLRSRGTTTAETTAAVFRKMAYRDRPEGLVGIAPQRHCRLPDLPSTTEPPLLLVAEAIEKPGNLGTMLRSADAAGATALVLCDQCTDLFNPNVVRASIGTLFSVPVAEAETEEAVDWMRQREIRILAASPHAELVYTDADMTGPIAIVAGTEQYGLSEAWLRAASLQVRIPMRGQADSLNVATAAALLLYEAVRQRN